MARIVIMVAIKKLKYLVLTLRIASIHFPPQGNEYVRTPGGIQPDLIKS